ncbi:hypothetical protein E3E14_07395 [Streptomyces sp. ICN441]|uniref:hypothetical protein n=1 Tax=Streptomyces sp. ICN441 TaxID=2558286 RepID=UPI00106ADD71|nr:hypothetical protein [Streptomyces sp. ICN441]TFE54555.1 hypothetical protein E3E14_07395 [Streptomyces sp. ICN441]
MSQHTLFDLALAVAAGVYVVLAVRWRVRARADRAAAAHLDAVEIDPYHALATAWSPSRTDRAAAAELLLAGLIQVDEEGHLSVTDEGADPARAPEHPVPANLLTSLRRKGSPVGLYQLYWNTEHGERRDAAAVSHLLPERERRDGRGGPAADRPVR